MKSKRERSSKTLPSIKMIAGLDDLTEEQEAIRQNLILQERMIEQQKRWKHIVEEIALYTHGQALIGLPDEPILTKLNHVNWEMLTQDRLFQQRVALLNNLDHCGLDTCERCKEALLENGCNLVYSESLERYVKMCEPCQVLLKQVESERILNLPTDCRKCGKSFPYKELHSAGPYISGDYCSTCVIEVAQSYRKICAICDSAYVAANPLYHPICNKCYSEETKREYDRVEAHNKRATRLGLAANLTLKQWLSTLDHFSCRCAYCSGSYQGLEHYLPLTLGGLTTVANCLPSCNRCNIRKSDKHPDDFSHLFPKDNMSYIQAYLAQHAIQGVNDQ